MADRLIRIARQRDLDAFRELYGLYGRRINSFMVRRGATPAMADELTQETFLAVWQKAQYYDVGRGDEAGWIFSIARNLHIDQIRRQKVWQEVAVQLPVQSEASEPELALTEVLAAERDSRVLKAIQTLPMDQADVIRLAFVDGLSHGQIAARIGIPVGTIKSRLRLAYAKLREQLDDLA